MNVAKDSNNEIVWVEDATKGNKYFCPECGGEYILRDGKIKSKHFAHKSLKDCDAWGSEMSKWHLDWQKRFPLENREVIITHNGETHRADVCIRNYVIEFQNSPMSCEEFDKRTKFYTDAGYKLIWIFNFREKFRQSRIYRDEGCKFIWKYWSNTFVNHKFDRNKVLLYFEMYNSYDFKESILHEVIYAPMICGWRSFSWFLVNRKGPFLKWNFVRYVSAGYA